MQNNFENKIDFYAQPGVNYLYIVFKLFKNEYRGGSYLAEAEKLAKLLNQNIHACEVKPLLALTAAHRCRCRGQSVQYRQRA